MSRDRDLLKCTESMENCDTGSEASFVARDLAIDFDPDNAESVRNIWDNPSDSPRSEIFNVANFDRE